MLLGPANVKSDAYDLPALPESWTKTDPGTADVAFRYAGDRSTISLNSVCNQYQDLSLVELTKSLMLGLDDTKLINQEKLMINGLPGLSTTTSGKMGAVGITVSLTVLRSTNCVYDFMLVTRDEAFAIHQQTYIKMVQGFRERGHP